MAESKMRWIAPAVYAVMAAALIFCAVTAIFGKNGPPSGLFDVDSEWNEGWRAEEGAPLELPCTMDSLSPVTIKNTLPEHIYEDLMLVISTDYLPIIATINGEPLEVTGTFINGTLGLTYANSRSIVRIPASAGGQTIELTLLPEGCKMHMELYGAWLGTEAEISAVFLNGVAGVNFIGLLLFVVAALLMAVSAVMRARHIDTQFFEMNMICMFIIAAALWFLTDNGANTVRYGANGAYLFVNLFSYLVLAIPMQLFLQRVCSAGRQWQGGIVAVFSAIAVGAMIAACFGAFNLAFTLMLSHLAYIALIVIDAVCMGVELLINKRKELTLLFAGIIIMLASGCATIVNFYFFDSPDNTFLFRYGAVAFALLLAAWGVRFSVLNYVKDATVKELHYAATRDALTGLYNKATFHRKMKELIERDRMETYAVCCFDYERFHLVNDTLGREQGDRILCHTANLLRSSVLGKGVYGRLESDKFVLCVPYNEQTVDMICESLQRGIAAYPAEPALTLSFGWYIIIDRTLPPETMTDRAANAKSVVKGTYLDRVAFYDENMRRRALYEQELVNSLDGAIADGDVGLYLQPKYDLNTGEIVGAEALARWRGPNGDFYDNDRFIPVLERNGLIMHLDDYMWRSACALLKRWIAAYGEERVPPISVNVSRIDIYAPNTAALLTAIVEQYGVPTRLMPVEVTETACYEDVKRLSKFVNELKRRGFAVHMDDFGSGYSSLNMLCNIAVDQLKIDMEFLYDKTDTHRSLGVLKAVADMAKSLGIGVVAEGVETAAQADMLREAGCGSAQGFVFCKPLTEDEAAALIFGGAGGR